MRAYGADKPVFYGGRVPQRRYSIERSNRGRARTSATPRNRGVGRMLSSFNPTWVRRVTNKKARTIAKAEIAHELYLRWLDQEVERATRGSKNNTAYLQDGE